MILFFYAPACSVGNPRALGARRDGDDRSRSVERGRIYVFPKGRLALENGRKYAGFRGVVVFSSVLLPLSDFFTSGTSTYSLSTHRLLRLLLLIHAPRPLKPTILLLLLLHNLPPSLRHKPPHPLRQIRDMLISALVPHRRQRRLQPKQILRVRPARPGAARNVLRQRLRVLRPDELVVVGGADVDERADGGTRRGGRRVEGRVVDRVAVDLANVEVFFDLGDAGGEDAVGDAPDALGGRGVVVG